METINEKGCTSCRFTRFLGSVWSKSGMLFKFYRRAQQRRMLRSMRHVPRDVLKALGPARKAWRDQKIREKFNRERERDE